MAATKGLVFEVSLVLRWGGHPLTVFLWKIQISPSRGLMCWYEMLPEMLAQSDSTVTSPHLTGSVAPPGLGQPWQRHCVLAHCHWCHLSSTLCSQLGHHKCSWPHIDGSFQLKPILPNSSLCVLCPQGLWKWCLMQIIHVFPFNCQNLSKK